MIVLIILIVCCCILPAMLFGIYMFVNSEEEDIYGGDYASLTDTADLSLDTLLNDSENDVESTPPPESPSVTTYALKNGVYTIQLNCDGDDPCKQYMFFESQNVGLPQVIMANQEDAEWRLSRVPGENNTYQIINQYKCQPSADYLEDTFTKHRHCDSFFGLARRENNIDPAGLSRGFMDNKFKIIPTAKDDVYKITPAHITKGSISNMAAHKIGGKYRVVFMPQHDHRWLIKYKRGYHPIKDGKYYIRDQQGVIENHYLEGSYLSVDEKKAIVSLDKKSQWNIKPVEGEDDTYLLSIVSSCEPVCNEYLHLKIDPDDETKTNVTYEADETKASKIKIFESEEMAGFYTIAFEPSEYQGKVYYLKWKKDPDDTTNKKGLVIVTDESKPLWSLEEVL